MLAHLPLSSVKSEQSSLAEKWDATPFSRLFDCSDHAVKGHLSCHSKGACSSAYSHGPLSHSVS
jgi:hypothetical protein